MLTHFTNTELGWRELGCQQENVRGKSSYIFHLDQCSKEYTILGECVKDEPPSVPV